jgi:hypothetical protein
VPSEPASTKGMSEALVSLSVTGELPRSVPGSESSLPTAASTDPCSEGSSSEGSSSEGPSSEATGREVPASEDQGGLGSDSVVGERLLGDGVAPSTDVDAVAAASGAVSNDS